MSRDRGPVLKRARALGIEPQYLGVNKKSKRHGAVRRRKKSEYGIQLALIVLYLFFYDRTDFLRS